MATCQLTRCRHWCRWEHGIYSVINIMINNCTYQGVQIKLMWPITNYLFLAWIWAWFYRLTLQMPGRISTAWWRHQMEIFSALLAICAGNSPVTGEFPTHRPVTQRFDSSFDLRLNKRLSKQSLGSWFETPSRPLWRRCNGTCTLLPLCSQIPYTPLYMYVSVGVLACDGAKPSASTVMITKIHIFSMTFSRLLVISRNILAGRHNSKQPAKPEHLQC